MKTLIICLSLNSPIVIYEPNEFTDEIIVYDYTETPQKCIEVTEPEPEKYEPPVPVSYDDLTEGINLILQGGFPL